jgi:hypothetical protein
LKTLVIHANFSTTITVVCPLAHHDRDDSLSDSLTIPKRKFTHYSKEKIDSEDSFG